MAIELATAYVSIIPETGKLKSEISKALGDVGKQSDNAGRSMGSKLASGLGKTLKAGAVGAGVGAGAALGTALTAGFGRLQSIEQAQATLKGLGHEASSVADIMNSANEAVTGTAYGLGDAASIAAQMVASGIKPGKELTQVLTTVADSSAIAGVDIGRFGSLFSKVAATGKLQGDEMNSVMEAGVPILDLLGTSLGKSAAEVREMVTDGQVDFKMFEEAMRQGMGGAAQEMGNTFHGSMMNMRAAMGRFGEALLVGPFNAAPAIFGSLTTHVNTLTNAVKAFKDYWATGNLDFSEEGIWGKVFGSKEDAQPYIDFLNNAKLAWSEFKLALDTGVSTGSIFGEMGSSMRDIGQAFEDAWPSILGIAKSVGEAGLGASFVSLTAILGVLAPILADVLVPILEDLAKWMGENQELVNMLAIAFVGFGSANMAAGALNSFLMPAGKLSKFLKGAPGNVAKLFGNFTKLGKTLGGIVFKGVTLAAGAFKTLGLAIMANPIGAIVVAIAAVVAGLVYFFTQTETGKRLWKSFTDSLVDAWNWVKESLGAGVDWVRDKFDKFTGWISDAWNGITSLFKGDFSSELSSAFGISDDHPVIVFFFKWRDTAKSVIDWVKGAWETFTGWFVSAGQGISDFWGKLQEGFARAGQRLSDIWDGLVTGFKWGFAIIATMVITPFVLLWKLLSAAFELAYNNVILPVIEGLKNGFLWLWDNAVKPVIDWVKGAWQSMAEMLSNFWNGTILPMLTAFGDKFTALWVTYVSPMINAVVAGWNWLKDMLAAGWNYIKTTVLDAFNAAVTFLQGVWESVTTRISLAWQKLQYTLQAYWFLIKTVVFDAWNRVVDALKAAWQVAMDFLTQRWENLKNNFSRIWENIKSAVFDAWNRVVDEVKRAWQIAVDFLLERWENFKNNMSRVWEWISTNVFDKIGSALETVKGWFKSAVDAIGNFWNDLKKRTAEPINWVISSVFNDGIRPVWNSIAGKVGLPEIEEPMKTIGGFKRGGVTQIPGYSPGVDNHTFINPKTGQAIGLSGGETVFRPEVTRGLGKKTINALNGAAIRGGVSGVRRFMGGFASGGIIGGDSKKYDYLPVEKHGRYSAKFAAGGVIGAMMNIVRQKYPGMIMTSGARPGQGGMHGAGLATDWATAGAFGNSREQLSLAHDIATTYPGSAELIYDSPGWGGNIKNGQNVGPFGSFYTMAQAGPHHNHVHWGMTVPPTTPFGGEVFEGGSDGGGGILGTVMQSITGGVKKIWDEGIGKIAKFPGADKLGEFGKVPGAYLKTVAGAAWEKIKSLADKIFEASPGGTEAGNSDWDAGAGAEQWRGGVEAAFRKQGEEPQKHLVDALVRQIWTESKGNPNIAQQIVDSNGTGASAGLGLYQFIPGTFAGYRDPSLPNDRTNPEAAHNAAVRYFRDRHRWNTGPGGVGRGHGWKSGGIIPAGIFDTGGVLKDGHAAVNVSGKPEVVVNNRQLGAIGRAADALIGVTPALSELVIAFQGDDAGYGALESYFGTDFAKRIVDSADAIGKTVSDLTIGFNNWAKATTEQDRMGTPEEWGIHFGSMAAVSFADQGLSLFGLGGLAGGKFNDSFLNLVNAAADTSNMLLKNEGVNNFRFGHLAADALQPVSLLDDTGRRTGTKLQAESTTQTATAQTSTAETVKVAEVKEPKVVTVYVDGDAITPDRMNEAIAKVQSELGDVKIEVKKLKSENVAGITSDTSLMA